MGKKRRRDGATRGVALTGPPSHYSAIQPFQTPAFSFSRSLSHTQKNLKEIANSQSIFLGIV
ncbi:hypothetical protein OUZ56_020017 [Daphnia magna]|uniref:Uncharacterized protein n=1 Tax=Daphnia magna TaxID=35525 RepID=A0ABQ9ZDD5_9CRUS|nr:hypothetical protein OUZ56_020017 [Daphnia magna]